MSRPRCPNHTCELSHSGDPRVWICPISDARFEVDADQASASVKLDKFGRPMTTFTVTALDGAGG